MRPVTTRLLWLVLATVLLLSFRWIEESSTFHVKFPAAPGWRAVGSLVTQYHDGPGSSWSIHVNGATFQRPPLINGGGKSLRITLQYQAPTSGAWIGLRGDPSPVPVKELTIQPSAGLTAPRLPDPADVYRISLPPTRTWTPVSLLVKENTPNLPYLTLFVGGPASGSPARFAAVSMQYADGAGGDLLSNGNFAEQWPAWAVHPEWLNQAWAPARFILILLIAAIIALGVSVSRNDGVVSPYIVGVVWTLLSALMLLGAAAFPDLARVAFPGDNNRITFEALTNVCLVFDVVCFAFAGWIGGSILGSRARYAAPLIPLLAAFTMTATAANDSYGGLLPPAASYDQFTSGFGVVWLIGGAAAAWWGVVWACRNQPPVDLDDAKYAAGRAGSGGRARSGRARAGTSLRGDPGRRNSARRDSGREDPGRHAAGQGAAPQREGSRKELRRRGGGQSEPGRKKRSRGG